MTGKTGWAAALAALLWLGAPGSGRADPAFGYWLTENGGGIVRIEPCGTLACGRMVWLRTPRGVGGAIRRDAENPDPALRDRALCGLPLMTGFAREAPGQWTGGRIYNPRNGRLYDAQMSLSDGGQLSLRGYVGLPLLGRSQTWTRVPDDRGGC